jgi:RimJ/RimL family protein N-acetyltransferase
MTTKISTNRLQLRPLNNDDIDWFAAMNACPKVMRYFPSTLDQQQSVEQLQHFIAHYDNHGFGFMAALLDTKPIGFVGCQHVNFEADFTPAVEIGWRLIADFWQQGFATEAAKAVLTHLETNHTITQLVSFTATQNLASQRVMHKLGMQHSPQENFLHPKLPSNHPLAPQVLYRTAPSINTQLQDK